MKYLINTTEIYRVNTESEAAQLIEDAKNCHDYILTKYSSQYKERKQKGEVIDSFYKVSLTKAFNDEKEPEIDIDIVYNQGSAF